MAFIGFEPNKINFVIIFLVVISFKSVFLVIARYSILQTKYAMIRSLITETYKSFFNARWQFFSSGNQGTMLNTFNREMIVVGDSLSAIGNMFADAFRFTAFIIVSFCISWQVTLIAIGSSLGFAIPLFLLAPINYRLGQKNTSTANRFMEVLQESISAAKIILGYGKQHKNITEIDSAFQQHRKVSVKSQTLKAATPIIYEPFGWLSVIITLYICFRYFDIPIAEVTIIVYSFLRIVPIIGNIVAQRNSISSFFPSYQQINTLNELARQQVQRTGSLPFKQLENTIELKGVFFAYPKQESVLKDIDAVINRGNMTAFVGESGSGKSTLIDVLIGFCEPCHGTVTIDGISLFEYDITSFRQKIGFVPQDSILFHDTIRNNLLWSYEKATEEEVVDACRLANAHDFIMEMPNDYDTVVGDRGVRLSGGQRQRIALARALLRKPELLILDEATSSLDSQSETLIQQAIEKIAHQTTIVTIAHRLSTIAKADWIYVLENGRIVEQGAYGELIDQKSSFNRMAELQGLVK
jgi:ATP-binding cassette subfamily B protein